MAVPNPKVIGEEGWAVSGLSVALDIFDRIEDQLTVYDEVYTIASSFGRFEIIVLGQFPSIDQLKAFIREELARIPSIGAIEGFGSNQTKETLWTRMRKLELEKGNKIISSCLEGRARSEGRVQVSSQQSYRRARRAKCL